MIGKCAHGFSLVDRCLECEADEARRKDQAPGYTNVVNYNGTPKPVLPLASFPEVVAAIPSLARERIEQLLDANNRLVEANRALKRENALLKSRLEKGLMELLDAVAARYAEST